MRECEIQRFIFFKMKRVEYLNITYISRGNIYKEVTRNELVF